MLNIKSFRDGERLVVVLEGMDIPAAENVVKSFFSSLLSGVAVTQEDPAYAAPIPVFEEECPPVPVFFFDEEPYAGKTPEDILLSGTAEEKTNAFKWLRSKIEIGEFALSTPEISDAMSRFLKERFKECDPEEYCKKLTDAQLNKLLTQHAPVISQTLAEVIFAVCEVSNWNALLSSDESTRRHAVCEMVKGLK